MQIRCVGWRKERPVSALSHTFHEQIGNPVCRVHVVSPTTVVAGVFAELKELFDIKVPGFKISANRAFSLTALVNGYSGVIDYF